MSFLAILILLQVYESFAGTEANLVRCMTDYETAGMIEMRQVC